MRDLLQQPAGKAAAALIRRDAVEKSISRSRAMRRPSLAPLTLSSSTSNKKKMNTQTHTRKREREKMWFHKQARRHVARADCWCVHICVTLRATNENGAVKCQFIDSFIRSRFVIGRNFILWLSNRTEDVPLSDRVAKRTGWWGKGERGICEKLSP